LQSVQNRKHSPPRRGSPAWWLGLVLAAFLLSCFPEQLAEYLASQDVCACSVSGANVRKLRAAAAPTPETVQMSAQVVSRLTIGSSLPLIDLPGLPETTAEEGGASIPFGPVEIAAPTPLQAIAHMKQIPPPPPPGRIEGPDEVPQAISELAELPGP